MCRNAVEKKTVLENLDLVLLAMDEIVDGGCVPDGCCEPLEFCCCSAVHQSLTLRRAVGLCQWLVNCQLAVWQA
jgi:hypothetical protein